MYPAAVPAAPLHLWLLLLLSFLPIFPAQQQLGQTWALLTEAAQTSSSSNVEPITTGHSAPTRPPSSAPKFGPNSRPSAASASSQHQRLISSESGHKLKQELKQPPGQQQELKQQSLSQLLHSIQGPVPLCSPDSIGLLLPNPSLQSATLLYANRHRNEQPQCSQPFPAGSPLLRLDIQLLFGFPCGVHSRRMTSPRVGLEHSLRVVLGMSNSVVADGNVPNSPSVNNGGQPQQRIFDVRCQYFADRNQTVGRVLELSAMSGTLLVEEPPPQNLGRSPGAQFSGQQPPECKYSIHANSLDGPLAERVSLGDRVIHRWRCGDEYALKVYRCFVHDGRKRKHQIINERGCSTDLSLMPHPQYSANLSHATAPSRVFRFSQSARVFFDCLLYACLKNDPQCRRATMPRCTNVRPTATTSKRRRRRRRREIVPANDNGQEVSANFVASASADQMVAPPQIEGINVRVEAGQQEDQNLAERQLRHALERSQKAVKALVMLNVISLMTAVLLGFTLCCQRRRLNARLAISSRPSRR